MPAVAAVVTTAWATAGGSALIGRLLLSVAVSAISTAIQKKMAKPVQQGIKTEYTTDGGDKPMTFVLGWYATDGHMVCPPMSHGRFDDWSNAYLTYVIDLGNVPRQQIDKVIIDDTEVEFETVDETIPQGGAVPAGKPDWWYVQQGIDPAAPNAGSALRPLITPGRPIRTEKYKDKVWLRYCDGTQAAADPYLLQVYGPGTKWAEKSERPWTADMVGVGTCYAILTFRYSTRSFSGLPRCRFVMRGTPLYDPRKDSTAGGSGTQRWDNPATWATTTNGIVLAYNILRGIPIEGGPLWGYGVAAEALPYSVWAPAMTAADQLVDGKPRWQAAWEVSIDEEPASVLDEVLKVCCAKVAEVGGVWRVRVGPPAAPVYFLTDDDLILDADATATPFPGLEATYNAVHATYPEPAQLWRSKDAPPRYNAGWETADQGRRLVAELTMPACPWGDQVQRIMRAMIEEERHFRRHEFTLPPDAEALEPLDVIAWSSTENGYDTKLFEVFEISEDPLTLNVTISVTEVDPADYDWKPDFRLPSTIAPVTRPTPSPAVPQFFTAEGISLKVQGSPRGVAARLRWGGWSLDGITAVRWETRLAGQTDAARGMMGSPEEGETIVSPGLTPLTAYEARISFLAADGAAVSWTDWKGFSTPAVVVPATDIDTTAPGAPPAVTLSSTPTTLTASWPADDAEAVYSDLEITEAGGNPLYAQTSGARYTWQGVTPGTSYAVRRRRVDRVGNRSNWSPVATHTVARDTVPPAIPTGLKATAGFNTIWIEWNRNTEADFSHYEVAVGKTNNPSTVTSRSPAASAVITEVPDSELRYVRIRAVDTSGNASGWTANVSKAAVAAPDPTITTEKLKGLVDATSFGSGVQPIQIWTGTALPTARQADTISWQGRLYVWNGTAYVDLVSASNLTGSIQATQFATGIEPVTVHAGAILPTSKLTTQIFWQSRVYKWNGTAYVPLVDAADLSGKIAAAQFAMGIEPVTIHTGAALPTTRQTASLLWNGKLYRWDGSKYTAEVASSDITGLVKAAQVEALEASKITGKLSDSQLADIAAAKITGQIVGTQISDDAVTTPKLAAGSVVTGKIAAGAVTADEIASLAITTAKLDAGAVSAAKIAAGAVQADKIAAGAVTAGKLAADAVTAGTIAADAVTAGKIAAGAINTRELAAGSIVASKLAIADFTNLVPDDQIQDASAWVSTTNGGWTHQKVTGSSNIRSVGSWLYRTADNPTGADSSCRTVGFFPVTPGDVLYLSAQMIRSGGTKMRCLSQIVYYDKNDAVLSGGTVTFASVNGTSNTANDFTGELTVPAGAYQARFRFYVYGADTDGNIIFGSPTVRIKNKGELIVDGSITASKIDTDAVVAGKIAAGAINTRELAAGAVVASKMTVADWTNLVADDQIYDANAWHRTNTSKIEVNAGNPAAVSPGNIRFLPSTGSLAAGATYVPARAGDQFYAEAVFRGETEGAFNARVSIEFSNATKTAIAEIRGPSITSGTSPQVSQLLMAEAPAGTAYVRLRLYAGANAVPNVVGTKPILRRKNGGELIVDGAVTADKISANAVRAGHIDAGAVTAQKLAVGFGGNFIQNSSFASSTAGWALTGNGGAGAEIEPLAIRSAGSAYAGPTYPTLVIGQNGSTSSGYADLRYLGISANTGQGSQGWPTSPGEWLEVSVQLSTHRCKAQLRIEWRAEDGTTLGYTGMTEQPPASGSSTNPDLWPRIWVKGQAPAGTAYAVLNLRKLPTESGTDSYLFVHKPMQTGSAESRSEPTPYAPGSFTYIDGNSIITDTIKARAVDTPNLLATIATIRQAFITDAHVVELSAATLKAGTALTGSLTVNGQPLATIKNQAEDPAARINAANTQIDPGKIRISGTTTLSDWRKGGDETRIDGGNISANTIKANALEIGSRNITLTGIQFEHNSPSTNKVSWTAGYIRYIDDTGATVSRSISAGNATWSSGVMYIYWAKGSNAFTTTSTLSIAMADNNVCIATYEGGTKLDADYGRTIVDGASIKTGTVTATQLVKTAAVLTDSAQIGDGIITNAKIGNIIQSSNFVTGEDGVGWQIDKAGSAEFNSVKIRRQLAVQTGTFNVSATTATLLDGKQLTSGPIRYAHTETSVGISAWAGAKRTYLAVAGMVGATATAQSATGAELWGWVAHVAPLTRWSDPQNLRIIFELWAQGITSLSAHQIKWTLYEVS